MTNSLDAVAAAPSLQTLLSSGPRSRSDVELLSTVLGGPRSLQKASRLIERSGSLRGLAVMEIEELAHVADLTLPRAARLSAALTLGRRSLVRTFARGLLFETPQAVFDYLAPRIQGLDKEHFFIFALDAKNRVIREECVSVGTLNASLVHPREVFRTAVRAAAHGILVAHNHPSGDPTPSDEDVAVTERLESCGDILGIRLRDHVVVAETTYISLALDRERHRRSRRR